MKNLVKVYYFNICIKELKPLLSSFVDHHHELSSTFARSMPVLFFVMGFNRVVIVFASMEDHGCNSVFSSLLGAFEQFKVILMKNVVLEQRFIVKIHIVELGLSVIV